MSNGNSNEIKDLISDLLTSPAPIEGPDEKHNYVVSDIDTIIEEKICCDVREESDENCNTIELPDPDRDAYINKIKEEAIKEYEAQKAAEAAELNARKEEAKKALKKTFSACGWSILLLMGVWIGLTCCFLIGATIMEGLSGFLELKTSPMELYTKYYLVLNEAALLVAVFIASLLLKTKETVKPEKRSVSFKKFLMLIPISFAVRTAGNLISSAITMFTGSLAEADELTELLSQTNPWLAIVFVGIVAPIIEELFFRKMLIDRLRPHGEMACLIVSALFFGLFHQNISQFFYAFGMGIVLAHLYYHSGRYSLAVVLHAIFNITGVIPLFFYDSLFELIDVLYLIEDGSTSVHALVPFIPTLIVYLVYALVLFALTIVGTIIIGMNYKKFKIQKSNSPLSPAEQRNVFWKTSGIIAAVAVTGVLTLLSL